MKILAILALLCVSLCAPMCAQTPAPNPGFTVSVQPTSIQFGNQTKQGILAVFYSDDPTVTAFVAEISYTLPGSIVPQRVFTFCAKNVSGLGAEYLWVGDASNIQANAWEIKTFGRFEVSR